MTVEKSIKINDLRNDLRKAEKSGDLRLLILYSNLYNEHFVRLLYEEHVTKDNYIKCNKCSKFLIPKFEQQVDKLAEIGIIDSKNNHDELIKLIFGIRNELSHKLEYNIDELEKRFEKAQNLSLVDNSGLISKFINNATSWEKIKLAVFATVTSLYTKYEESKNRKPNESIRYLINPEGTKVVINVYKI